jgi:hypothetical protein
MLIRRLASSDWYISITDFRMTKQAGGLGFPVSAGPAEAEALGAEMKGPAAALTEGVRVERGETFTVQLVMHCAARSFLPLRLVKFPPKPATAPAAGDAAPAPVEGDTVNQ